MGNSKILFLLFCMIALSFITSCTTYTYPQLKQMQKHISIELVQDKVGSNQDEVKIDLVITNHSKFDVVMWNPAQGLYIDGVLTPSEELYKIEANIKTKLEMKEMLMVSSPMQVTILNNQKYVYHLNKNFSLIKPELKGLEIELLKEFFISTAKDQISIENNKYHKFEKIFHIKID